MTKVSPRAGPDPLPRSSAEPTTAKPISKPDETGVRGTGHPPLRARGAAQASHRPRTGAFRGPAQLLTGAMLLGAAAAARQPGLSALGHQATCPAPALSDVLGLRHAPSQPSSASTAMPLAAATTAFAPTALPSSASLHPFAGTAPAHAMSQPPAGHNHTPGGRAAQRFQQHFQQAALDRPGTVKASRTDLGFKPDDLVMLDIGGEGQKTDGTLGMKSGNLHAINVNAQTQVSPGNMRLQVEPDGPTASSEGAAVPNLVQLPEWPSPKAKAAGFLPFADGLSNLTVMEGAPVFDYHVEELARITSPKGWMVLSVSDDFQPRLDQLAEKHNGGTLLKLNSGESGGSFSRFVIPPASVKADQLAHCKARFESADSHDVFDVVQSLGRGSAVP